MMSFLNVARFVLLALGLGLFLAAERYFYTSDHIVYLRGAQWFCLVLALAGSGYMWARTSGEEKRSLTWVVGWQVSLVVGICIYYLNSSYTRLDPSFEQFGTKVTLGAWLTLFTCSLFAGFGIEYARAFSGVGPFADSRRVLMSLRYWLAVGMLCCSVFALNYFGQKSDKIFDWTYFKTTKPGESTTRLVGTIEQPLKVMLFYPAENKIKYEVAEYFSQLERGSKNIQVFDFDRELNPNEAAKYRIGQNGQVVLEYNERQERIDIGLEQDRARKKLSKLDQEVQKRLLSLTREAKYAYFTRGHGEMSWVLNDDRSRSLQLAEQILRLQNYRPRLLDGTNGAFSKIPDNASVVAVVGPTKPFLPAEITVLQEYIERGGSLFVALDVDSGMSAGEYLSWDPGRPLLKLLEKYGITFHPETLANENRHVRATNTAIDKWFLHSNNYSAHESVSKLAGNSERVHVLSYQTGHFTTNNIPETVKVFDLVKTFNDSFNDRNRNTKFDSSEENKRAYAIDLAVEITRSEGKEARIFLSADSSQFSDVLLGLQGGNQQLFFDALKWLQGEEDIAGDIATEEDVKIQFTNDQDIVAFYSSLIGVPLLTLLAGFIATRRRKR